MRTMLGLTDAESAKLVERISSALFEDVPESTAPLNVLVGHPGILLALEEVAERYPGFGSLSTETRQAFLELAAAPRFEAKRTLAVAALLMDGEPDVANAHALVPMTTGYREFLDELRAATALPHGALRAICATRPRERQRVDGIVRLKAPEQRHLAMRILDGASEHDVEPVLHLVSRLAKVEAASFLDEEVHPGLRGEALRTLVGRRLAGPALREDAPTIDLSPMHRRVWKLCSADAQRLAGSEHSQAVGLEPLRQALAAIAEDRLTDAVVASTAFRQLDPTRRLVFLRLLADNGELTDVQAFRAVGALGFGAAEGFARSVRTGVSGPLLAPVVAVVAELDARFAFAPAQIDALQRMALHVPSGAIRDLAEACGAVASVDLWNRVVDLLDVHADLEVDLAARMIEGQWSYGRLDAVRAEYRNRLVGPQPSSTIDVLALAEEVLGRS